MTRTETGRRHLASLAPAPTRSRSLLPWARLSSAFRQRRLDPWRGRRRPAKSGRSLVWSAGWLPKGYDDLLAALALLPSGLEWRFVHIGGGALGAALRRQAERLGLSRRIEWRGALAQPDVLRAGYRGADLFVLASGKAGKTATAMACRTS